MAHPFKQDARSLQAEELATTVALVNQVAPILSLTKREFFAAMALAGMRANPHLAHFFIPDFTRDAIRQADSILAALSDTSE